MNTYNSKGEHHGQFAARTRPARHCNAHSSTFGGCCFTCDLIPTQAIPLTKAQQREDLNILKAAEYYHQI